MRLPVGWLRARAPRLQAGALPWRTEARAMKRCKRMADQYDERMARIAELEKGIIGPRTYWLRWLLA